MKDHIREKHQRLFQFGWNRKHNLPMMGCVVRYEVGDRRVIDREEFSRITDICVKIQDYIYSDEMESAREKARCIPQWYRDLGYETYSGNAYLIARTRKGKCIPVILHQRDGKPSPRDLEWLTKMEWRIMRAVHFKGDMEPELDDVDPAAYGDLWAGDFDVKQEVDALLRCNGLLEFGVPRHMRWGSELINGTVSFYDCQRESLFLMGPVNVSVQGRILSTECSTFFGFIP